MLKDVVCNGKESQIFRCENRIMAPDCTHSQDVSVSCVTGMKHIATTQIRACAKRAAIIGSCTVIWAITYFL